MVISLLSSSLDKAAEGLEAGGDAELAAQARGFAQAFSSLLNNNSDEEARKHYETLKGFKAFIEGGRDEARSNYNKVKAELLPDQQQFDIFASFI